jgi:hypothetical protein
MAKPTTTPQQLVNRALAAMSLELERLEEKQQKSTTFDEERVKSLAVILKTALSIKTIVGNELKEMSNEELDRELEQFYGKKEAKPNRGKFAKKTEAQ